MNIFLEQMEPKTLEELDAFLGRGFLAFSYFFPYASFLVLTHQDLTVSFSVLEEGKVLLHTQDKQAALDLYNQLIEKWNDSISHPGRDSASKY